MHESGGTQQSTSLTITPQNLTPPRSSTQRTSDINTLADDSPPGKVRSLKNVYESCSFALNVTDPTSNEEAAKQEVWLNAIKEELIAIERNHTWQLVILPD